MKSEETRRWELLELCERARDGKLTALEEAELDTLLRGDPEMRALFARSIHLDAELRYDPRLVRDLIPGETIPFPRPAVRRTRALILPVLLAAAACLTIGAMIQSFVVKPKAAPAGPVTVATVVKASGCKWGGSQ